tara:strand:- start:184 stop:807 length:624 start_codon:yes stop_codon:yes gene_type:complete
MLKVAIIDYGIGNLRSVINAFNSIGVDSFRARSRDEILASDTLVLPGVGAFGRAMEKLEELSLVTTLKEFSASEKPVLGICLGMQLLFESSEEFGYNQGLGLIPGNVKRLPLKEKNKLPHIGWVQLEKGNLSWDSTILKGHESIDVYFVHSYHVVPEQDSVITSFVDYSDEKCVASVQYNNIHGCQFHPEKSSYDGLDILKNFANLA